MSQNAQQVQQISAAETPPAGPPPFRRLASDLNERGYVAVPVRRGSKAPLPSNWNAATAETRATWPELYPDAQTGVLIGPGGLFAIDADTDDEGLAEVVDQAVDETFGPDVLKRGREGSGSPRMAYLLRCSEAPGTYRPLTFRPVGGGTSGPTPTIELFSQSRQLLVSGIHPSGDRYRFANGRNVRNTPVDELVEIDGQQLATFVERVVEGARRIGWEPTRHGPGEKTSALGLPTTASNDEGPFAGIDVSQFSSDTHGEDDVRLLLDAQNPAADRGTWFGVLAALHEWDSGETGRRLAVEWSRCETYLEPEADVRKVFDSLSRGTYAGSRKTLASLIADRKRYDEERSSALLDAEVVGRVNGYRDRLDAGGDISGVLGDIRADEVLTDDARKLLVKPVQEATRRAGLSAPDVKSARATLGISTVGSDSAPGRIDIVGRVVDDFDATLTYYTDREGNAFAERLEGGRRVVLEPHTQTLDDWLVVQAPALYGKRTMKTERAEIHDHVAAKARASGIVRQTFKRYAYVAGENGTPERVLEDVGDAVGTVIEMSAAGVREVASDEDMPFRFVPGQGSAPSSPHRPVEREELAELARRLLASMNVPKGMEIPTLAWLVDARMPHTSCPVLFATGGHGSGKSALVEQCVELTDPQVTEQVAKSKDQRAFRARLGSSWVTAEHNAQKYTGPLQDDLCVAADGGSVTDAKLYRNNETITTRVAGPVAISAILPTALTQVDVLSRALELRVTPPPESERLDMSELRRQFAAELPEFHALLRALTAEVLRLWPELDDARGHRYGSFARVANGIARVLGEPRSFAELMRASREWVHVEAFEGSLFAQDVLQFVAGAHCGGWEGPTGSLLKELPLLHGTDERARRRGLEGYPQVGREVWGVLDDLRDGLTIAGVDFARGRRTKRGQLLLLSLNANAPARDELPRRGSWSCDEFDTLTETPVQSANGPR